VYQDVPECVETTLDGCGEGVREASRGASKSAQLVLKVDVGKKEKKKKKESLSMSNPTWQVSKKKRICYPDNLCHAWVGCHCCTRTKSK